MANRGLVGLMFMRYYLFLVFIFCARLSAATFELNVAELFPQQNLIQAFQLNAECLPVELTFNDGQTIEVSTEEMSDLDLSSFTQISIGAPNVNFKVITQNGQEWSRSLSSFRLKISHLIKDGRKVMTLDIHAIPSQEPVRPINFNFEPFLQIAGHQDADILKLSSLYFFKTLLLLAEESIHLKLEASVDIDNSFPGLKFDLELGGQSLVYELNDHPDGIKIGAWKIQGVTKYEGKSLINLVLSLAKMFNVECQKISAETPYDRMLQNFFNTADMLLSFLTSTSVWEGLTVIGEGSFVFQSNDSLYISTELNNHFRIGTNSGNWRSISSKGHFSFDVQNDPQLYQKFIVRIPVSDLESTANWIKYLLSGGRHGGLDVFAYMAYGVNVNQYMIQALTLAILNIGEIHDDGTVSFGITLNPKSFSLGNLSPLETIDLIIAKIKELIASWWE
jgi:hypothetical protein